MKTIYNILLLLFLTFVTACSNEEVIIPAEKSPAIITWDGVTINVEQSPQWCVARSNRWVAFTNYGEKSQYHISWDGDMAMGKKEKALLRISDNGGAPVDYRLKSLELSSDGINCTLTFVGINGETGSLIFPL